MGVVRDQTIIYAHYQLQTITIQVAPVAFIKKMFPNHAFQISFLFNHLITILSYNLGWKMCLRDTVINRFDLYICNQEKLYSLK